MANDPEGVAPDPVVETPETKPDPLDQPVTQAEQDAIDRELERREPPPASPPPTPPIPPKPVAIKEPPSWMWWAAFGCVVAGTIFAIVYVMRQGKGAREDSTGSAGPS